MDTIAKNLDPFETLQNIEEKKFQKYLQDKEVFRNEVVSCIENMEERTSGVKDHKGYSNRIFQTYNKNIGTGKLLFIKIPVFKRICKDNYVNEVIGEFEDLGYIFEWKKFYGNDWECSGHHLYITL